MCTTPRMATALEMAPAPVKMQVFKNILFATDFSEGAKQAFKYATSLARRHGSALFLTHVVQIDGYPMVSPEYAVASAEKLHAKATEGFKELMKTGELLELPYKVEVVEGNLWPAIEEMIKKYAIDLVVVGTHGAGTVEKLLIGSSAEEIFRKAKVPVLTVGPAIRKEAQYEMEFANILFATDFGLGAEREAEFAYALAKEHCARLRIVHVIAHPEVYGKDVLREKISEFTAKMRELMAGHPEIHCKLDYEVLVGEPVKEILERATEINASLIVMGAKQKASFAGNVPHTKAYQIVCGANCPVLTVRS